MRLVATRINGQLVKCFYQYQQSNGTHVVLYQGTLETVTKIYTL